MLGSAVLGSRDRRVSPDLKEINKHINVIPLEVRIKANGARAWRVMGAQSENH